MDTFNWTKPLHPPAGRIRGQSTMRDFAPGIEQGQVIRTFKTVVFADQADLIIRLFPDLEGMDGIGRHQRLISSGTMRMGELRGPK